MSDSSYDYKKEFKELYMPAKAPALIDVPEMKFIQISGKGNPNIEGGEYQQAVQALYSLSFTIKMAPKQNIKIDNYFNYVVPPLEGLWWLSDKNDYDFSNKEKFLWIAMIRQPEFVDESVFQMACEMVRKKKPEIDISKAKFVTFTEGLCVQCMHIGSYDDEPETISKIEKFVEENNLVIDISETRRHHEIYLSDPRKTDSSKLKTILRYPVRRK